jgi:hypothetical protein
MKKKTTLLLALLFYFSILPALPGWAAPPVIKDLIVKESPHADVRAHMSALTYLAWLAAPSLVDLTPEIQATIDNVYASGITLYGVDQVVSGTVFIPKGKFYYSGTLYAKPGVDWEGKGPGSVLWYTGSGKAIDVQHPTTPDAFTTKYSFSNFSLYVPNGTVGIYTNNVIGLKTPGLFIWGGYTGCSLAGVQVNSASPQNTFNLHFDGITIKTCTGDGIRFTGSGGVAVTSIRNAAIQGNGGWGIIDNTSVSNSAKIMDSEIEGNSAGQVYIGYPLGARLEGNHFEMGSGTNTPVKWGTNVVAYNSPIVNNLFGCYAGTVNAIDLSPSGGMRGGEISHNYGSGCSFLVNWGASSGVGVLGNVFISPMLFDNTSTGGQTNIFMLGMDNTSHRGSWFYDTITFKKNSAIRGSQIVKPGDSGSAYQRIAYPEEVSGFAVGDIVLNAAPVDNGYVGWVNTYAGRAHNYTNGTISSGSDNVTSVGGAIWDWQVGDPILTDTDALGITAGTTVIAKGGDWIQLSANATANGTVTLYGARFRPFGKIE